MKYNISDISIIVKGELVLNRAEGVIEHILLDSRKLIFPAASLFFALTGPRRNGQLFIAELYEKGLRNFVVSELPDPAITPDANIILVKDALAALHLLTSYHRKQFNIPVIGITGSNGKTIVKEWLSQLLEEKYRIVKNPKSYNSQIGVPLSVWQMDEIYELAIFEAGISESDEMSKLEKIIQPTIGIFTNIGEAHSEGFLNIRQKVNEKLQLFKHVDTLIYCKDYPSINEGIASYIKNLREGSSASKLTFFNWSFKTEATLRILAVVKETDSEHTIISALYNEQEISIRIPFSDEASIENSISCWSLLLYLNIDSAYTSSHFDKLTRIAMRLELKKGINNCSIINDSYSADLSSLKIALDFLSHQQQHVKKTVILSDILQSGKNERDLYTEIADSLQQKNIQRLIGIGPQIIKHQQLFAKAPGMQAHFYAGMDAFRSDFPFLVFSNETILLKGARMFEFEQISQLLEQKVHQTVLEIDQTAILHNLNEFQKLLRPATKIMAMVKAFSYGSGSFEIANLLQFHKVDYLAVAYADEAVDLRKSGITLPMMVMNPEPSTFDVLVQFSLQPDIYAFNILHDFDAFLQKKGLAGFPVHIELETGMNRLGFELKQLPMLIDALQKSAFSVQSVFSHLVASEDPAEDAFTQRQAQRFGAACDAMQSALGYSFIRHLDNSAGTARHPELQLDMVRLGIGLYGINNGHIPQLDLVEVSTLKTTIAQIKQIPAGQSVGYNRRGVMEKDGLVATVRLGYADGYPRRLGNGVGKMFINGRLAPVIGNVCMDMTMIDISHIPGVQEGDDVIVFGKELSVQQIAQWAGTIPYEIMTGVSQRVKRVYFE